MSTQMYLGLIDRHRNDKIMLELMETIWNLTPWMIGVFTGPTLGQRSRDIKAWCREHFGPESNPTQNLPGNWKRGWSTADGLIKYGFKSKELMDKFQAKWSV